MSCSVKLPCWEITHCDAKRFHCSAFKNPDIPCWELVKMDNDYRKFNHICTECIVYILKKCPCDLSQKEMSSILSYRGLSG